MEKNQLQNMAVCGLDCGTCDIRLVPADPEAAQRVTAWFHEMGWLEEGDGPAEIIEREMYCNGCREDRSLHWSAECPMLICCVDEKHLDHCGQCPEFLCEKLETFANDGSEHHAKAVDKLKEITQKKE